MAFYNDIGADVDDFFATSSSCKDDYNLGQTFSFLLKNGGQKVEAERSQVGTKAAQGFVKYGHKGVLPKKFGGDLAFKVKNNSQCTVDLKNTKVGPVTTDLRYDAGKKKLRAQSEYTKDSLRFFNELEWNVDKSSVKVELNGTASRNDMSFGLCGTGTIASEADDQFSLDTYGAAFQYDQPAQNAQYSLRFQRNNGKDSTSELIGTASKKMDDDCTGYVRMCGSMNDKTEEADKNNMDFGCMFGMKYKPSGANCGDLNLNMGSNGAYNALYSYKLGSNVTGSMSYNNTLAGDQGTIGWKLAFA